MATGRKLPREQAKNRGQAMTERRYDFDELSRRLANLHGQVISSHLAAAVINDFMVEMGQGAPPDE